MRHYIFIAENDSSNLELLKEIFKKDYSILAVSDGKEALSILKENINDIALILLNVQLSPVNGYQLLQILSAKDICNHIPVVMLIDSPNQQAENICYELGAATVICAPYTPEMIRARITHILQLYQDKENLENVVAGLNTKFISQQQKMENFYDDLTDAISNIIEFRDLESGMHVKRVKGLTKIMAQTYSTLYPKSGLTPTSIHAITRASALHDIGKITVPDSILLKPGTLTENERLIIMSHTTKGCEILNLLNVVQDDEQFRVSYEICRHHHERYDGNGYPDHLAGEDIPLSAQLVSIVDVYDALVSERVYKRPYDKDTAYDMILNGECGAFSPRIIECFSHSRKIIELFSDTWQ